MEKLRVGLEWFLNPDHIPFLLAEERGWFREAGLTVELVEPTAHEDAQAALDAGTLDIAITEPLHLVEDAAKGASVRGFWRFLHTNGGVMYLAASGIRRPRDMANVRVQYPGAPGPGGPAIIDTMVVADGGKPGKLTPVNEGFAHTDALIDNKADVATLAFFNFEVVEARHRGHDAHFFALKDWGVPDFCQLILIAKPELLDRRSETVASLTRILSRAVDVICEAPQEARALFLQRPAEDPELIRAITDATLPNFTRDPAIATPYWRTLSGWMKQHALIDREPTLNALWDSRFVFPRI